MATKTTPLLQLEVVRCTTNTSLNSDTSLANNPSAQVFPLAFLEGGNNYDNFWDYRAFNLKRSAGVGLRIFMPMFGLMGVDVAYGFDPMPNGLGASGWQTHFIIGQQF